MHGRWTRYGIGILGAIMILGGLYGFWTLYQKSRIYERVTGVVVRKEKQPVHHPRKKRYTFYMQVAYPTHRYGTLFTTQKCYRPFCQEGDSLTVLYRSDAPRELSLPGNEGMLWGGLLLVGALLSGTVWFLRKQE